MVKPKKYRLGAIIGCIVLGYAGFSAIAGVADIAIDTFRGIAPTDPLARWLYTTMGVFLTIMAVAAVASLLTAVVVSVFRAFRPRGRGKIH